MEKYQLPRGTKERIEEIKETLKDYTIVYSKDTKEIGIKEEDGTVTFIGKASEKIIPNHKLLMVDLANVSEEQETILDPVFIMNSQDFGINIDDIVFVVDNMADGNIVGYCRVFGVNEDNTEVTLTKIKNIGTISIDLTDYIKKSDASPLVVPDTVVSRRPDGLFDVGTPLYPENPVNLLYTDVNLTKKTELNKELSQVFGSKNLAVPDLTGKEYLGNGEYRLSYLLTYNVYNGVFTLNGESKVVRNYIFNYNEIQDSFVKLFYVSGISSDLSYPRGSFRYPNQENVDIVNQGLASGFYNDKISNQFSLWFLGGKTFDNYQFKLQLEKGTTATPYTLPTPFVLPHELTSGEWITPTLLNGWTNVASNELQYRKDINGNVQLRGHLNGGTLETVIATLPAVFRPLKTTYFICSTDLTIGSGTIEPNGNITLVQGDLTNVRLDTISFSTL